VRGPSAAARAALGSMGLAEAGREQPAGDVGPRPAAGALPCNRETSDARRRPRPVASAGGVTGLQGADASAQLRIASDSQSRYPSRERRRTCLAGDLSPPPPTARHQAARHLAATEPSFDAPPPTPGQRRPAGPRAPARELPSGRDRRGRVLP
jgi:hypothetical protein